jgi:hypothetical protein
MNRQKYGQMREVFLPNFPGLHKRFWVLEKLIQKHLPELGNHFVRPLASGLVTFLFLFGLTYFF